MLSTDAILIRLTALTDTSWIVHWFSAEQGLFKTVAKGARRPNSSFAGKLDLFFSAEIVWTPATRGDLHHLREVAVRHWREGLRRSYTATLLAGYFCRLLELAVEPGHPDPMLHDLLQRALDHVVTQEPGMRALSHFESELARHLGISNEPHQAEYALREQLGALPGMRRDLCERLSSN